jgi:hemoglobin
MFESHSHLDITLDEWQSFMADLDATFDQFSVPQTERHELIAIVESTRDDIIKKV